MIEWVSTMARLRLNRRHVWSAVIVLLAVGLGSYWLIEGRISPRVQPEGAGGKGRASAVVDKIEVELTEGQAKAVKVEPVGRSSFDIVRQAVGSIDFNQNLLVQVFTPYQGRIVSTHANVGDLVEAGQVLFTVDSPDLLQASSTLIAAAGVLVLQTRNLKRVTETLRGGGGPQKDVDQATSDLQAAEGALTAARNAMRIFGKADEEVDRIVADRRAVSTLVVRSPITGYVTARTAAPGLFIQPGNAPAPFTVADTSIMWMIANVVEGDSALLRVGQDVRVRISAFPNREFAGTITVLGASVDPQTRRIMVRSEIKDPERLLRAGMFANFTIQIDAPVFETSVPNSAVVREGDGSKTAWVTTDSRRFEKRSIRTGLIQGGMTQILEGLNPGDLVVSDGAIFLSNKLVLGATE